jgi:hypothetical protein
VHAAGFIAVSRRFHALAQAGAADQEDGLDKFICRYEHGTHDAQGALDVTAGIYGFNKGLGCSI